MMKNSHNIIYLSFFLLGVFVACMTLRDNNRVQERVVYVTDTLIVTKVDTFIQEKPKYITRNVVDTLYIEKEGKVSVFPIYQKHYAENGMYDAWVSGVQVSLDSIKTYNKIEYKTITNTKTVEREVKKIGLYPYIGVISHNGTVGERIGLTLTTKNRLMFSGEVGVMGGKMYYGGNIGYKIN